MTFRYLLFALIFLGSSKFLSAQDLIITNKNDTIIGKITSDDYNYIYFISKNGDSSKVKAMDVSKIRRNYLAFSKSDPIILNPKKMPNKGNSVYRLYINTGYSNLSAKTISKENAELDKQTNALKNGYHYSIGATYYSRKNIGIGLKYLGFNTSNTQIGVKFKDSNNVITFGELSDNIYVNYFATTLGLRAPFFYNRMELLLDFSVGYVQSLNNSVYINPIKITGKTIGLSYDIGLDYKFNKRFAAGIKCNIFQAKMKEYTYDNGVSSYTKKLDEEHYDNIARVEFSGGFRYYINR